MKSTDFKGGKSIISDPMRAPLITRAFEMFATGLHSKEQVLDTVTRLGLTTKCRKRVSPQTFCQLLRKPIYAGILEVPKWNIRQKSNVAPLVSREVFDRVQALLDGRRLTPTPRLRNHPDFPLRQFVRFGEIIMDDWKQKQADATALHETAQRQLTKTRERKQRLVDSFVYKREIDPETCQGHLDKLREEIALAEIAERDARIEKMDV
jgi:hypothetical protein